MSNPMVGSLFETHVALDILKRVQTVSHPPRAHHWRAHSGAEVDLLLERDGMFVAVEAKSAARVSRGDTRGIRSFRETYPRLNGSSGIRVEGRPLKIGG